MNISPEAGKFWFTVAVAIVLVSFGLLFVVQPGTSAYFINLFSLGVGAVLLTLVIFLIRRSNM